MSLAKSGLRRAASVFASANPAVIAAIAGTGIVVFVVLGILQRTAYPWWALANLDSEASAGTFFAATLFGTAAFSWVLVAYSDRPRTWQGAGWAALLVVLALDEANAFHESLERSTSIDWQLLYLPVMAIGGLLWWHVVKRHMPSPTSTLLIAVAVVWALALVLELVQNWGGEPVRASIYDPAMVTEEGLEMVGSTLVLLAGVAALRRIPVAQPE